jgi:hypothetical protein
MCKVKSSWSTWHPDRRCIWSWSNGSLAVRCSQCTMDSAVPAVHHGFCRVMVRPIMLVPVPWILPSPLDPRDGGVEAKACVIQQHAFRRLLLAHKCFSLMAAVTTKGSGHTPSQTSSAATARGGGRNGGAVVVPAGRSENGSIGTPSQSAATQQQGGAESEHGSSARKEGVVSNRSPAVLHQPVQYTRQRQHPPDSASSRQGGHVHEHFFPATEQEDHEL